MFARLLLPLILLPLAVPAQDAAQLLLKRAADTARDTRTLSADILLTRQSGAATAKRTTGTITLMKPNYALIQLTGDDPPQALVSDGIDLYPSPIAPPTPESPWTATAASSASPGGRFPQASSSAKA